MTYLVLDLDESSIVSNDRQLYIHSSHNLWGQLTASVGDYKETINIINPEKLTALIEKACETDGVIILTSGLWNPDIRQVLAKALHDHFNLSTEATKQLTECWFYSPETELALHPDLGEALSEEERIKTLQLIAKSQRLERIIKTSKLEDKSFVIFDDNSLHISSFISLPNVIAIQATTAIDSQACYQEALIALDTINPSLLETVCKKRLLPNTDEELEPKKRHKNNHVFYLWQSSDTEEEEPEEALIGSKSGYL